MKCDKCNSFISFEFLYCPYCGNALTNKPDPIYAENYKGKAIYEVTMSLNVEVKHLEHLLRAINNSTFGDNTSFENITYKKIVELDTKEHYHYECMGCLEILTNDPSEHCIVCKSRNWAERE